MSGQQKRYVDYVQQSTEVSLLEADISLDNNRAAVHAKVSKQCLVSNKIYQPQLSAKHWRGSLSCSHEPEQHQGICQCQGER